MYQKLNLKTGDTFRAEHVDHIERGMLKSSSLKKLEIGNFVNKSETGSDIALANANQYIASGEEMIGTPYYECRLLISCKPDYVVKIGSTNHYNSLPTKSAWLTDGTIYTVPAGHFYLRFYITHKNNTQSNTIAVSASTILEDSGVEILYEQTHDVVASNVAATKKIALLRSTFIGKNSSSEPFTRPVITHITDTHGDVVRVKNVIDYSEAINATCLIASGDICCYRPENGWSGIINALSESNVPVVLVPGNHDMYQLERSNASDNLIYTNLIEKLSKKFGYIHDPNAISWVSSNIPSTYYYFDNPKYKLRFIGINEYERLGAGSGSWNKHMNQPQVDFIINAFRTAPADYNILAIYHEPDIAPTGKQATITNAFYQRNQSWGANTGIGKDFTGSCINEIVDAFQNRAIVSKTLAQANTYTSAETSTSSITIDADFSACESKFVGHFNGHFHTDMILNMQSTATAQPLFDSTQTVCFCGRPGGYTALADGSDVPRIPSDWTQDSFNTYVIDPVENNVHVVRVGSNETTYEDEQYRHREYLVMPYHTHKQTIFLIKDSLIDCERVSGPIQIEEGETSTLVYKSTAEGELPENITVVGATLDSWDPETGTAIISNPTSTVTIYIELARELPSGYTRVNYIEAKTANSSAETLTGINTGIIATDKTGGEYCFAQANADTSGVKTNGVYDSTVSDSNMRRWYMPYFETNQICVGWGAFVKGQTIANPTEKHVASTNKLNCRTCYIDGVKIDNNDQLETLSLSGKAPIIIGSLGCPDGLQAIASQVVDCKYYWVKLWQDQELVRNMVPVIRDSDSRPGFYDFVSEEYLTYEGAVDFIYG